MDVRCSTCDEPWDVHHLWHDEIYETDLSEEECEAWLDLPQKDKLNERYRAKFASNGWQFGNTVINVIRCPACPKDAQADPERVAMKSALEDLLGDDEDGIAAMMEDFDL